MKQKIFIYTVRYLNNIVTYFRCWATATKQSTIQRPLLGHSCNYYAYNNGRKK